MHLALHVLVPALAVALLYRKRWQWSFLLLMAGMVVDVDHVLATPIYDPLRCSMGFHPLHTWPAVVLYAALLVPRRTRLFGVGLLLHMLLDTADCVGMNGGMSNLQNFLELPAWIQ
jgi:hypothetical protein